MKEYFDFNIFLKPISKDENAKKLAQKFQANFVMTLSTFENLLSQYQNEEELLVVFKVQEFSQEDGNAHKSIFIEKPLIAKNLSKREKNEKFYKKSLISTFTKEPATLNRRFISNRRKISQNDSKTTDQDINEQFLKEDNERSEIRKQINLEKFETETINYDLITDIETFGVTDVSLQQKRRISDVETVHFEKKSKISEVEINENIKEDQETEEGEVKNEDEDSDSNLVIDLNDSSENQNKKLEIHMNSPKISSIQKQEGEENDDDYDDDKTEIMGPASPENEKSKEPLNDTNYLSEQNTDVAVPKVIPLEKPNQTEEIVEPLKQLPTLNNLMSKIHEKLLSSSSMNDKNTNFNPNSIPTTTIVNKSKREIELLLLDI